MYYCKTVCWKANATEIQAFYRGIASGGQGGGPIYTSVLEIFQPIFFHSMNMYSPIYEKNGKLDWDYKECFDSLKYYWNFRISVALAFQ